MIDKLLKLLKRSRSSLDTSKPEATTEAQPAYRFPIASFAFGSETEYGMFKITPERFTQIKQDLLLIKNSQSPLPFYQLIERAITIIPQSENELLYVLFALGTDYGMIQSAINQAQGLPTQYAADPEKKVVS